MHSLLSPGEEKQPPTPTNIRTLSITTGSATIEWSTTESVLTPITYRVQYGESDKELTMESEAVAAEPSAEEQELHTTLSGLEAQTLYYFIVIATNTVGTSRSEVESFETSKDSTGTTCTHSTSHSNTGMNRRHPVSESGEEVSDDRSKEANIILSLSAGAGQGQSGGGDNGGLIGALIAVIVIVVAVSGAAMTLTYVTRRRKSRYAVGSGCITWHYASYYSTIYIH